MSDKPSDKRDADTASSPMNCSAAPNVEGNAVAVDDLYHALRLGLEGTEKDRILCLRKMAQRYPNDKLRELNAKYVRPYDILR